MGFIGKIGKAKAKVSRWMEEREQRQFDGLRVKAKMSEEYSKRHKEKKMLQDKVSKAKKERFESSFFGKAVKGMKSTGEGLESFGKMTGHIKEPTKASRRKRPKGKKRKSPGKQLKKLRDDFDYYDGDPWA